MSQWHPSLGSSVGSAMVDAAHGAMLGEAIGQAHQQADAAEDKAMGWYRIAMQKEDQLKALRAALRDSLNERDALQEKLSAAETEVIMFAKIGVAEKIKLLTENNEFEAYGKKIKMRLKQIEKALQHSSADQASMKSVLDAYKELVEKMDLQGKLSPDLKKNADSIWDSFMGGCRLTVEPEIQAIVDAAPMPEATTKALARW